MCVFSLQAVAMYNSTYIPFNDPQSATNASVTITLRSSDTAPQFGQSYYEANLREESPVNTIVPNLGIFVRGTNVVRSLIQALLSHGDSS